MRARERSQTLFLILRRFGAPAPKPSRRTPPSPCFRSRISRRRRTRNISPQGIAEEILNVLANVSGLEVASRTSSFQFKGQEKIGDSADRPAAARAPHPGRQRAQGGRHDPHHGAIDRREDRQASVVADLRPDDDDREHLRHSRRNHQSDREPAVEPHRRAADRRAGRPQRRHAKTPTPMRCSSKGRRVSSCAAQENINRSMAALERAVEIDPGFARAWAVLAADYSIAPGWLSGADLDRDFPTLAVERGAKGDRHSIRRFRFPMRSSAKVGRTLTDYEAAILQFRQAIARNPKDETIYMWRGEVWRDLGFFDRAIADFERCLSLNPDYNNCREHKSDVADLRRRRGRRVGDKEGECAPRLRRHDSGDMGRLSQPRRRSRVPLRDQ